MKSAAKKIAKPRAPGTQLQFGALPYRFRDGTLEILLVTSRETRRWVIPKGWPKMGLKPHAAAAREAKQEAGVVGVVRKEPLGLYGYVKWLRDGAPTLCMVAVFPLEVLYRRARWREQHERSANWFLAADAAAAVDESELQEIISGFAASAPRPEGQTPQGSVTRACRRRALRRMIRRARIRGLG